MKDNWPHRTKPRRDFDGVAIVVFLAVAGAVLGLYVWKLW
jgi:hypothetical protein